LNPKSTFVSPSKFNYFDSTSVEYYQPGVDVLNRDNVALLVRLSPKGSLKKFVVATTHLLYNPKREDVRLAQSVLLVSELERFCTEVHPATHGSHRCPVVIRHPCIVTGDFNLQPNSPVYGFLAEGSIKYDHMFPRRPHRALLPPKMGITNTCQVRLLGCTLLESRPLVNTFPFCSMLIPCWQERRLR
jgi:protein angel